MINNFKIFTSNDRFTHDWLDAPELERIDSLDGRKYKVPSGDLYQSVTTFLGNQPKPEIDAWREAVGEDKANRISKYAADRGSNLHDNVENYLLNHTVHIPKNNMVACDLMSKIAPQLQHISNIRLLETPIYSDRMKLAGTVDCVADWQGVSSIIDFKTSTQLKDKETVTNYWLQTCIYSLMCQEMFDLSFKQLVLIIGVEFCPPQIFVMNRKEWIPKVIEILKKNEKNKCY